MPEHVTSSQNNSHGCIFLWGMPRSGTTWLGKLFDSHPRVLYRHEPDTWRQFAWTRYPSSSDGDEYGSDLRAFVAELPRMDALRVIGKQPMFPKAGKPAWRFRTEQAAINLARVGSRLYRDFPVLLHDRGARNSQQQVVWKSVNSLGRLGLALGVQADARGIHILRHPCGVIASVQRGLASKKFRGAEAPSEDYGIFEVARGTPLGEPYDLSKTYLQALMPAERLAWRWVLINEKAWLDAGDSPRYLPVCYEDVCDDPLAATTRMFEFAGLEMNPQSRAFIEASTGQNHNAYYSVFKNPQTAAWRWRDELDGDTIDRIMAIVERSRIGAFYLASKAVRERAR